jgi:predicted RNA binding protein YcfA (HicA-like mRNA interferase family)
MARTPQVSARELARFLKSQGFVEDRQSGLISRCATRPARSPLTVPVHTNEPLAHGMAVKRSESTPQATKVLTTSEATPARMNPTIHFSTSRSASILEKRLS